MPDGDFVRLDTFCESGALVSPYYDNMIAKLIVYGHNREEAIDRMLFSLDRLRIDGIRTNVALQKFIVGHPDFTGNGISTRWLEQTGLPDYLNTLEE